MSTDVRVRFAPSPTGLPHIGNIRTALFNWLFARHYGGTFIVRIEDTDQARMVDGSVDAILNGLAWLGIDWDEGPYYQSERLGFYHEAAQNLLASGHAYPHQGAVWFKIATEGNTNLTDIVRGRVKWKNSTLKDFVILKSDGYPTYHLASVVDDHLMRISHVIRAEEWLPSAPRHLQLYEALGYQPPLFAHLPMILGTDRSKLSKRHGATAIGEYEKEGYLPEAMLNFMVLLGWSLVT